MISCLFSGDIYLSFGISLSPSSVSFVTVPKLLRGDVPETSVILLPIKSPIVYWITLFEVVLCASVGDFLVWSRSFRLYLPLKFLLIFLPIVFFHIFCKKQKSLTFYKYSIFRFNWITSRFYIYVLSLVV